MIILEVFIIAIAFIALHTHPVDFDETLLILISVGVVVEALNVAGLVFFIFLASKLYEPVTAVVLSLCIILPGAGLIVLLVVNAQATSVLRENGIRVGLFGARRSDSRRMRPITS